ncbi:MAG: sodium/proton-translocating pyrophosphatase, partial [Flammeovirgaceae bacterium]|nr:sodium/proton-translocating pyrophosphatase [Flammeovirgaceae bacterium]
MESYVIYLVPALGLLALGYTLAKSAWVTAQDAGDAKMQNIAGFIAEGAMAFLKAEWKLLSYFVIVTMILLGYGGTVEKANSSPIIAVAFVIGAVFSCLAGYIGMRIATKANV